jgi:drug/metabolite transporter (DMT)-like permease
MPEDTTTSPRLDWRTSLLLLMPPVMWAGNAVVGRLMQNTLPPLTFNFLRWVLAGLCLLPVAGWVLRPGQGLWSTWRRFAHLGLLGVGMYNALQYLALKTSNPMNVTLVAASTPVWMLLLGRVLYGVPIPRRAALGAALSLAGVATVLSRGDPANLLQIRWVAGDAWMLLAALSWAWYSWLLVRPPAGGYPASIRGDWSAFLFAQIVFGLGWSGLMTAGEWSWPLAIGAPTPPFVWGWPMAAALIYVAIGPSLLAYRCWGAGVARVGPSIAGFFTNLTPLIAAILSALLLGDPPQPYHALAFVLIVGGIVVSSRR